MNKFELGQIIPRDEVDAYIKRLAYIDEDMLNMYTGIFKSFICVQLDMSDLYYDRINEDEELETIEEYAEDISNIPPIVTSPVFGNKRVVYDGCHRCKALELNKVNKVTALVPYKTSDGRLVEDLENNKPEVHRCKHGTCDKGKCCISCEHNNDCDGVCCFCFELGETYEIVAKNVPLFCNGVW